MNEVKDINAEAAEYMEPSRSEVIAPDHEAWMVEQTNATLAKKRAGEMEYHALDDVMRKFGHYAR